MLWLKKLMRAFLVLLLVLLVLAMGSLAVLQWVDPNVFRAPISEAIETKTQIKTEIGEIKWQVYPWIGLQLKQLQAQSPTGVPLAQVQAVHLAVALWPLLQGDLVVQKLQLQQAEVWWHQDAKGQHNWQFLQDTRQQVMPNSEKINLQTIQISEMTLTDMALQEPFSLAITGRWQQADQNLQAQLNTEITLDLDQAQVSLRPVKIDLAWQEGRQTEPFLVQANAQASFAWESGALEVPLWQLQSLYGEASGQLSANLEPLTYQGNLAVKIPQIETFLEWAEVGVPEQTERFKSFDWATQFQGTETEIHLTEWLLELDEMAVRGDLSWVHAKEAGPAVPLAPKIPSFLSGLKGAGHLAIEQIEYESLEARDIRLDVSMTQGQVDMPLRAELLQGGLKSQLHLDLRAPQAKADLNLTLTEAALEPLAMYLLGEALFSGGFSLKGDWRSQGVSMAEGQKNLRGQGAFSVTQGMLHGTHLAEWALNSVGTLKNQLPPGLLAQKAPPFFQKETLIQDLSATLDFQGTQISTQDLSAQVAKGKLFGRGMLDWESEKMDLGVELQPAPEQVPPFLQNILIPVRCMGTLSTVPSCGLNQKRSNLKIRVARSINRHLRSCQFSP